MNIWHDIPEAFIRDDSFTAVIEISKGGKNKYELDKQTGLLRLDRVLYTSTHYPANYGFIPLTFAEDDDPLDVLVICAEPINPMTLVQVYPIGAIHMLDGGRDDDFAGLQSMLASADAFAGIFLAVHDHRALPPLYII